MYIIAHEFTPDIIIVYETPQNIDFLIFYIFIQTILFLVEIAISTLI